MASGGRIAGGTIAAKSTLSLARVVARSFRKHHPTIPFYVLLADEIDGYFDPAEEPYELLLLRDLEIPDPKGFRFAMPQQPLSYAATPYLIAHLLSAGFGRVLFVKQESLVLGDLTDIVAELPEGRIAVTPHVLGPLEGQCAAERELNILMSGVYNAGLLGVAAGASADAALAWWQERVYGGCRHAVAEGIHYEQRWLDLIDAYFGNLHIVRDERVNVAHWNLPERACADGDYRLFRFSGYDVDRPAFATRYSDRVRLDRSAVAPVYERYGRLLLSNGYAETSAWPYAYAQFDNGVAIPDIVRAIYAGREDRTKFGDPFAARRGSFFDWLTQPVGDVTNLWYEIHRQRPDLQNAFSAPAGRDARAYARWVRTTGVHDYGIPPALQ